MPELSPIGWAMRPLIRYANFSGRAPRAEYWWFFLFYIVALIIAIFIDKALGSNLFATYGIVSTVLMVSVFIPSLAAVVRRLHDADRSAWWLLLYLVPIIGAIVILVFLVSRGTAGPNRFGADPLHERNYGEIFA